MDCSILGFIFMRVCMSVFVFSLIICVSFWDIRRRYYLSKWTRCEFRGQLRRFLLISKAGELVWSKLSLLVYTFLCVYRMSVLFLANFVSVVRLTDLLFMCIYVFLLGDLLQICTSFTRSVILVSYFSPLSILFYGFSIRNFLLFVWKFGCFC